eukprot:TRINITY_DN30484_c0_g1_i1.p2 TRINITY_DN30484_c0_g1~~TRINITY_DN30484_c0_g1_i1.p2  ORF type:complete len:116 (+),score=20.29 TRINITY_DN30484_c0_g1_i1:464-811(+)
MRLMETGHLQIHQMGKTVMVIMILTMKCFGGDHLEIMAGTSHLLSSVHVQCLRHRGHGGSVMIDQETDAAVEVGAAAVETEVEVVGVAAAGVRITAIAGKGIGAIGTLAATAQVQ